MKIHAVICTRDRNLSPVTKGLLDTLSSYGVDIKLLADQDSIFEAYSRGVTLCDADEEDIIILCHDDLQILSNHQEFLAALSICIDKKTGIVGPAGTTLLGEDAVWWNQNRWAAKLHRGSVKHQVIRAHDHSTVIEDTSYGPCGQVAVLDGLFLAARKEVWTTVGLNKPDYFEGSWDFYDIHYTSKANELGYKNYAIPLDLIHMSRGELVGRDSWHKNREAFIANTKFPVTI